MNFISTSNLKLLATSGGLVAIAIVLGGMALITGFVLLDPVTSPFSYGLLTLGSGLYALGLVGAGVTVASLL